MAGALLTDLYELNMAASYLRRGMDGAATFSLFVRRMPPHRGFLVSAGLEACLEHLKRFAFDEEDLTYLAGAGFDASAVEAFRELRFTGEVWAVPEGRIVYANEPLLEVTAPIAEAQLAETFLLNAISLHTTVATKAARCRIAAEGRELVDFSFRRDQGVDAALAVARACALVGFAATSNVDAAHRLGLRAAGTMAHSYVESFPSEVEAFRAFAEDFPGRTTFLVDTYDTFGGVRAAIEVIRELGLEPPLAVRLDSGDLAELSRGARGILDEAGLPEVRIFASGGLDEYAIEGLARGGAPIDAFGVGTMVGVSADAPYVDSVYKLVSYDGRPVSKLSPAKATAPGAKQVFRGPEGDVIALRDEPAPGRSQEPMLRHAMADGQRTAPTDTLEAALERFEHDLAEISPDAARISDPVAPEIPLSDALRRLDAETREEMRARQPSLEPRSKEPRSN